jgi:hypothetical protein
VQPPVKSQGVRCHTRGKGLPILPRVEDTLRTKAVRWAEISGDACHGHSGFILVMADMSEWERKTNSVVIAPPDHLPKQLKEVQ